MEQVFNVVSMARGLRIEQENGVYRENYQQDLFYKAPKLVGAYVNRSGHSSKRQIQITRILYRNIRNDPFLLSGGLCIWVLSVNFPSHKDQPITRQNRLCR